MSMLTKIPIIRVCKELLSYREWIKTIKKENMDPNSIFNKYNMKYNNFYNIYLTLILPEEDKVLPDNIKQLRVFESLSPVHRYIDNDLGYAGYIVPEFNQVFDDENNPTLSYVIVYRFAFDKLSIKFIITRLLFLIGVIIAAFKLPWANIF